MHEQIVFNFIEQWNIVYMLVPCEMFVYDDS